MLRWALTFLIIAIVAAIFGFTGIETGFDDVARIVFFVFIILFIICFLKSDIPKVG